MSKLYGYDLPSNSLQFSGYNVVAASSALLAKMRSHATVVSDCKASETAISELGIGMEG